MVVEPRQQQISVTASLSRVRATAKGGFVACELPKGLSCRRSSRTMLHSNPSVESSNSFRGFVGSVTCVRKATSEPIATPRNLIYALSVTSYICPENVAHARVISTGTPVISRGGQNLNSALGISSANSDLPR